MTATLQRVIALLGLAALALVVNTSQAQDADAPEALRTKLSQAIEVASQNQLQITAIKQTPLSNIYQVELSTGEILYSDVSGDYLFAGDMYQTSTTGLVNLSSDTRQARNLDKLAAVPEEEMIVFTPEQETKASITVFTDVDCTYCRALHRDLDDLLSLGIQVRYMAYPRGGENADSFDKMISVWCSNDRHKTLTQAKNGQNLPARECDNPVLEHYALGNEFGISGTPALVFPDGRVIPGYLEPARLSAMLNID